ncbi:MAG: leucine-rich repeat domain-containing protein [Lachnospiraceae bacterium]|nr:leucine-rich repeat domain-containing protein [Lachnospiraceae bacterium]
MQEKDVFISYKAEELKEAEWVRDRLEKEGITCWLAPGSIPGGSSYAVQIPKAIRECLAFVLILSKNAQESKWVPRELDQAINANKVILPFMIENCPLKDEFSFYLSNVQRYEAWQNREKAFSSMVRVIRALVDEKNKADSSMLGVIRALADAKTGTAAATGAARGTAEPAGAAGGRPAEAPVKKQGRKERKTSKRVERNAPGTAVSQKGTGKKKLSVKKILLIAVAVVVAIEAIGALRYSIRKQQQEKERAANAFILAGKEVSKTDTTVYLKDAAVTKEDIELFGRFEKLNGITFESCTFETDLMPLLGENLSVLTIRNCDLTADQFRSLDFSTAPRLSQLDISENPSVGEAFRSGGIALPENLTLLKISGTGISDLTPLAPLVKLTRLEAENNGITDLSPLAKAVNLQVLDVSGNELADLSALKECTSLTGLDVSGNQLESLEGIEACIRMETLRAGNNRIGDLDALSNMTILKKVSLPGNHIEMTDVLAKSAATLEELDLAENAVADISPLEKCTALKMLILRHNAVKNMEYVRSLENLQTLDISENAIAVADGLSHLKSLETLDISDNPLEAGFGIWGSEWPTGVKTEIDASNCGITNGMTLKEELYYRLLDLHGSNFDRIPDALTKVHGDTVVLDWNSGMKPEKLKELYFNYIILLDVPLDQVVSLEDTVGRKLTHMSTEEYESKKAESE